MLGRGSWPCLFSGGETTGEVFHRLSATFLWGCSEFTLHAVFRPYILQSDNGKAVQVASKNVTDLPISLSLSFWISTNYTVYIIPVIQSCVCCRIVFAPLLEFLTFQQLPELVLSCQAFHVLETAVDSGDCWLNFRSTSGQCLWVESARCNCPMAPAGVRGISTEPRSKASTR